jgi:hypothetical protein
MSQLTIQKAGSASDVTSKNSNRVVYGNILGQELAAQAGIIGRVSRQGGGGGSSSSRSVSAIGGSIFTYAERTSVVNTIVANTATNTTTAAALSAAATNLGIVIVSPFATAPVALPSWSPISVTGIRIWLDGADPAGTGTKPANGATVSIWADKSGNGYSTTGVVGTPTFSLTSGILFNGTSHFTLPNGSIPFNNTSYTIYSVLNFTDFNGSPGWFGAGAEAGSQSLSMRHEGGSIRIYWYANDISTTSTTSTGVTFIFGSQYQTGGLRTAFINGTAAGADTPSPRSQPNTRNTIGRAIDQSPINGSIRDIIVYDVNHTRGQRQQVEGYLAWKWGIQASLPNTHTYFAAPPMLGVLPPLATSVTDIYTMVQNIETVYASTALTPKAMGSLTLGSTTFTNYDLTVAQGNTTVSAFSASTWFTSTEDTSPAWIVVNGDLTINGGQTFTPAVRKLFTVLYVTGNLVVNGSISMTARGANHSGTGNSSGSVAAASIPIATGTYSGIGNPVVPAAGGAGGTTQSTDYPNPYRTLAGAGLNGSGGGTGGGGAGPAFKASVGYVGNGSAGTSFTGGSGGAGISENIATKNTVIDARTNGGAGGAGISSTSGGGTGNPGGSGGGGLTGTSGTGGILIVICGGTISGSGTIQANGVTAASAAGYVTGGSSGGGSVTVLFKTSCSITPTANGGNGNIQLTIGSGAGAITFGNGGGGTGTARNLQIP